MKNTTELQLVVKNKILCNSTYCTSNLKTRHTVMHHDEKWQIYLVVIMINFLRAHFLITRIFTL